MSSQANKCYALAKIDISGQVGISDVGNIKCVIIARDSWRIHDSKHSRVCGITVLQH